MVIQIDRSELANFGVQFGGLIRWRDPRMSQYIYGVRNSRCILDLEKIVASCYKLQEYVADLLLSPEKKKQILFVTTKKQLREIVKEQAERCGMPYVIGKWKGGTMTNYAEVKKKILELQNLNTVVKKESFLNLAKKTQIRIEKKRKKLQDCYEGVMNLWKKPDAVFIVGLNRQKTAFKEAQRAGVPTIAICNTNCNPKPVDLVVLGNDESLKSVTFFVSLVASIIVDIQSVDQAKGNTD